MILVGEFLGNDELIPEGHKVEIDDDRRVIVFRTTDGRRKVYIINGDREVRLALSPEAAIALLDCLGASLEADA